MKTTNDAKKYIKNFLSKHDSAEITVDQHRCLFWWNKLNQAIFDESLAPPIRFECRGFLTTWGWCYPWRRNKTIRRVRIGINTGFCDWRFFIGTIAHEMIHQWEWEILQRPWEITHTHDFLFEAQAEVITEELGITIWEKIETTPLTTLES